MADQAKKRVARQVPRDLTASELAEFWSHVAIRHGVRECWEWTGRRVDGGDLGYGRINIRRRDVLAHRLAFAIAYGRNPGRLHVLHSCDNNACCNPRHLRLGTEADNGADQRVAAMMATLASAPIARPIRGRKHYGPKAPRKVRVGVEVSAACLPDDVVLSLRWSYWSTGVNVRIEDVAAAHAVDVIRAANAIRRQTHQYLERVDGEPDANAEHGRIVHVSKRLRTLRAVRVVDARKAA